jgi:hypothetical protein
MLTWAVPTDPDDLIFPRIVTRIGPKYQTTLEHPLGAGGAVPGPDARGGDDTIEVLSLVNEMSDDEGTRADIAPLGTCQSPVY